MIECRIVELLLVGEISCKIIGFGLKSFLFDHGGHGLSFSENNWETVLPFNGQQKGFASGVEHVVAVVRPCAQEHSPPLAFGRLDQIGMTGTGYHVFAVVWQVALRQNGVVSGSFEWSPWTFASENHFRMVGGSASFGSHHVVVTINFV